MRAAANKTPLSDAELERMYRACESLPDQPWKNGNRDGVWTGEDYKTFHHVQHPHGLRISYASTFSIRRLNPDNTVVVRAHKNGRLVSVWIPDELADRLRSRPLVRGEFPFLGPDSERKETAADLWRRRLNDVFALCGQWEEPPTPHRFRHTFARILLQQALDTTTSMGRFTLTMFAALAELEQYVRAARRSRFRTPATEVLLWATKRADVARALPFVFMPG